MKTDGSKFWAYDPSAFWFITDFCGIKSFAQAFLKACGFQRRCLWSPTAVGETMGNTAQIAAHALLESYSVS
ncbi:MAG: hypothetical protein ACI4I5_08545, partial [Acutalibacteraceae bacterium]